LQTAMVARYGDMICLVDTANEILTDNPFTLYRAIRRGKVNLQELHIKGRRLQNAQPFFRTADVVAFIKSEVMPVISKLSPARRSKYRLHLEPVFRI
ncbi:hypothetical protein, partial [Comamonas aquatica]|uniref:hypothetical protein n=3 Tax=Comamonadaceae TaxID=80864 RepID=UPI0024469FC4